MYEHHVTSSEKGIVIVGGGLAAARTAEQLRRADYTGPIMIVSDEVHLPYDRPPLSKEVLRKEVDDVALKPREWYVENDITLRLGSAATSLDTHEQTVTLDDGTVLGYDELVIATGLVPRRIPAFPDLEGIRVLRSFDESMALREHASAARRAVVIGAGFIGCEVAASLRSLGVDVVLVEPQPTPLAAVLGEQIGELVARLHRDEGVDVRLGVGVAEVRGQGHVDTVVLTDGTELPADLVVVGIGSRPATEWLDGSGVEPYALGVRNSVGFDFRPGSKELYFTDNGRDWLSEDIPHDELNRVSKAGQHFGYPYCHQGNVPDDQFGWGRTCSEFEAPVALIGPHAGALGMRFYTGGMFPAAYRNTIFIARHGSWNKTAKIGGDIIVAKLNPNGSVKSWEPFLTGFMQDNAYIGRPVDVEVMKDGSLLVSDDYAGAIYRVSYDGRRVAGR